MDCTLLWYVVFDLGGVIGGNLPEFFEVLRNTNPHIQHIEGTFQRNKDLWEKIKVDPSFSLTEYWEEIRKRENIKESPSELTELFKSWTQSTKGVIDLMKKLRAKGIGTAICSNHGTEFFSIFIQKFGLLDLVDPSLIVVSQTIQLIKPDPKIFAYVDQQIIQKIGLDNFSKDRVVLVDDQSKNTVVARSYGWHAIEYLNTRDSVDELTQKLIQLGVPLDSAQEL